MCVKRLLYLNRIKYYENSEKIILNIIKFIIKNLYLNI